MSSFVIQCQVSSSNPAAVLNRKPLKCNEYLMPTMPLFKCMAHVLVTTERWKINAPIGQKMQYLNTAVADNRNNGVVPTRSSRQYEQGSTREIELMLMIFYWKICQHPIVNITSLFMSACIKRWSKNQVNSYVHVSTANLGTTLDGVRLNIFLFSPILWAHPYSELYSHKLSTLYYIVSVSHCSQ